MTPRKKIEGKPYAGKAIACVLICVAALCADAREYFVDVGRETAGDGLTETTALRTITSALAKNDVTVITVLPGVYGPEEGDDTSSARISITKSNITLRSRDGAAVTHIVGLKDYSDNANYKYGIGEASLRCIIVSANLANVVIQGFTLRDGAARYSTGSGAVTYGGAVFYNKTSGMSSSAAEAVTVRDCIIRDCAAPRGGALWGVTAANCVLRNNRCTTYGAAARQCNLRGCLIDGNIADKDNQGILAYGYTVENCTIVNNATQVFANFANAEYGMTNTICIGQGKIGTPPLATANCIFDLESTEYENCLLVGALADEAIFAAPAIGDFRLIEGCRAVTANPALSSEGIAYCGWKQETVSTNGLARIDFTAATASRGVMYVDGWPVNTATYLHCATATNVYEITFSPKDPDDALIGYDWDTDVRRWPDANGKFRLLSPGGGSHTFAPVTGTVKYVAPDGDNSTADGTAEKPYGTLAGAVDNSSRALIVAKAGSYANGSVRYGNHINRVYFAAGKNVRLVAEEGPEKTFIVGESDPEPAVANDWGVGENATRCVAFEDASSAVQGFTLTGGRSTVSASYGDAKGVRGGGVYACDSGGAVVDAGILDCVISNCVASRGAAIYGGCAERCLIAENHVVASNSTGQAGILRYCSVYACVLTRNSPMADAIVGQAASAFNCTIASNKVAAGTIVKNIASTVLTNCVLSANANNDFPANSKEWNCVYEASSYSPSGCVRATTTFADMDADDWRPYATCAGSFLCSADCWRNGRNFTGFDGERFPMNGEGKITAGAVGTLRPAFFADSSARGGVSPAGLVTEFPDGVATVTATLAGRTLVGFEIAGVTQTVAGVSIDITESMAQALAPLTVNAVYAPRGLTIIVH